MIVRQGAILILGIDIGTSKTAALILAEDGQTVAVASRPHAADLPAPAGYSEQDALSLLQSARAAVQELPPEARRGLRGIGVTGQMHGVLLLDRKGEPLAPLVTWQDGRCGEGGFLQDLNARTGAELRSGFGCATLAWFCARGRLPEGTASGSTIQDWIAARLCGDLRPVTDPTDGASWGLFDLDHSRWNAGAVAAAGIPEAILPEIVACGQRIGETCRVESEMFGIPRGIPVAAAIGDNQASLIATLREPEKDLALSLGTGGQLSAVQPAGTAASQTARGATWEYRPYPGGRLVAVAASLCGGSAWQWLAETIQGWTRELGFPRVTREEVFTLLNELGTPARGGITVHPHFLGERHDPGRRASIEGISLATLSLGELAHALAEGICANLRDMLPVALWQGRARLMGSGNALQRNPLLQSAARAVFGAPLHMSGLREAAAAGAALNAGPILTPRLGARETLREDHLE